MMMRPLEKNLHKNFSFIYTSLTLHMEKEHPNECASSENFTTHLNDQSTTQQHHFALRSTQWRCSEAPVKKNFHLCAEKRSEIKIAEEEMEMQV